MDFIPYEPIDDNQGQKYVWEKLKNLFRNTEGVAYYRYPIFTKIGRLEREPDIVFLIRKIGLWVIECKGCGINNIASVQGHEWKMRDWHKETESPVAQAEDQMFAIKNKLDERRETRNLLSFNFRVALPFVDRSEWLNRNFNYSECIFFRDDFNPNSMTRLIQDNAQTNRQNTLSDEQWELVKNILGGGKLDKEPPRSVPTNTPQESPVRILSKIESKMSILDQRQQKIAFEIPPGPQRIRGLAGTGKTVLFAKRIAKMHARHPEWEIAFVFFTQALYGHINQLIDLYHREMTGEAPNRSKIHILHSWGGRKQKGFYSDLALKCGQNPKTLDNVKRELKKTAIAPSAAFEYICDELEKACPSPPEIYDAVLIDEGQDLPPSFYRLAYKSLKSPKRLYWAYDEAQGIGTLIVPRPKEIFGENPDGTPVVDLGGNRLSDGTITSRYYEGGIAKAHNINKCYRASRQILMTAHAINMGLYRKDGPLQGVTRQEEWESLGYKVEEGDFSSESVKAQKIVRIKRPDEASPHMIDSDTTLYAAAEPLLAMKIFDTEELEREWIAESVAQDLNHGLAPEDILITGPSGDYEKKYFELLKQVMEQRKGIKTCIAGVDTDLDIFRIKGFVTIAPIFRAKGNEAWKVYVCRFHYADRPMAWKEGEEEIHKRNEAFTAITRCRLWCVLTGLASPVFDEIKNMLNDYPYLKFTAFNQKTIARNNDEEIEETYLTEELYQQQLIKF
ncbi:MAG: NERD domain-containing protein [Desulfobacterales bacterium]